MQSKIKVLLLLNIFCKEPQGCHFMHREDERYATKKKVDAHL